MSPLYDTDLYAWALEQAALLREGAVAELDLQNLAEAIEDLARSDRRALDSHLRNLLVHLLKWQYQPSGRLTGHSWRSSIRNPRIEIAEIVEDSRTLERLVPGLIVRWDPNARQQAAEETGLPLATFPETCPWEVAQVLDHGFYPGDETCGHERIR